MHCKYDGMNGTYSVFLVTQILPEGASYSWEKGRRPGER